MKSWVDRIFDWPGWRVLGSLAACLIIAVVLYVGWTVHQHNNQLNCIKQGFDQVLNEALNHAPLTPPPSC